MKRYSHKTCQNRHDFFKSSPAKYHARAYHRFLIRYFVGPSPAIFTIPALLPPPFN